MFKRFLKGGAWTSGRLIAVLPPIACLILCAAIGYREFQNSRSDLLRLITDEISRSIGAEVTVDDVQAGVPGRLTVRGLRITKEGFGPLITAKRGVIHYSLFGLITDSSQPLASVDSLDLYTPEVFIERYADGTINLVEAFRQPTTTEAEGFTGPVTIRDARIVFTDNQPPSRQSGRFVFVVSGVDGHVDITDAQGGLFTATVASSNAAESLTLRGGYTLDQEFILSGKVNGARAAILSRYAFADPEISVPGGQVTGDFLFSYDPARSQPFDFWMDGMLRDGSVIVNRRLPTVGRINGRLKIAGAETVSFDGSAFAANTAFMLKGSVTGFTRPVVWVDASSSSADFRTLSRYASDLVDLQGASVTGRGPVNVKLRGPLEDLSIQSEFSLPQVAIRGQTLSNVRGNIVRNGNTITVQSISAVTVGGRVAANGVVTMGQQLRATGQGRFAQLPMNLLHPDLSGTVTGDFRLAYQNGRQSGSFSFAAASPAFRDTRFTTAIGQARLDGDRLLIDSLTVSTINGFASAEGQIGLSGSTPIELQVSASGLNLTNIASSVDVDVEGFVDFQGEIAGSVSAPVFSGDVYLSDVRYQDQHADAVLGSVTLSPERFSTDRLVISRDASEITIEGAVSQPLTASRRFDLNTRVNGVDLSELAQYAPGLSGLQGWISGSVDNISGNTRDLRASFDLIVEQARYGDFDAPLVTVEGSYDRGNLTIDNLVAERGRATVSMAGTLSRDNSLDFSVEIQNLAVDQAFDMVTSENFPVAGDLNFRGRVGGTVQNPQVSGSLLPTTINTVGQSISITEAPIEYAQNVFSSAGFAVNAASGSILVQDVQFNAAGSGVEADITIGGDGQQPVNISQLAAIARAYVMASDMENPSMRSALLNLPERIGGNLTGTVSITSPDDMPSARVTASISDFQVLGRNLGQLNAQALATQDAVSVSSLTVEEGNAQIIASGSVSYDGVINGDLEGFNIPVLRLAGLEDTQEQEGTADFSFQASGTVSDPLIEGSVLVSNVVVEGLNIEQVSTGRIVIDRDSIDFAEATITSGPHVITIAGTAPFSITRGAMVDGGVTRLEAELANPDLDVLTVFSGMIDEEKTQGAAEARMQIEGPWPQVQVNGYVRVTDGSIGIHNMSTVLRNIQIDITSDGSSVNINNFSVSSSDGGRLAVTGGAQLTAQGWQMDVNAQTTGFGLKFRNISRTFQESYNGKVDLGLTAQGPVVQPLIAGRVVFHDGDIGLPAVPETTPEAQTLAFNPNLNISLEAGRRLRIRSSRINVSVGGAVRLVNNLQNPAVNGSLSVTDGYLLFPGSRFRVVPVGSINFRYEPPEPTRVTLDIRAETEISSGTGTGVQDYRVEMSVTGPLSDPRVAFASYPPGLETSRILAMLGQQAGIGPGGFGGQQGFENELAGLLTTSVAPTFLEPIETALADAFGFQEVALGIGGRFEPMSVMVRRRINSKISVSLLQFMGDREEQREWKLSYDINRRLRVSYGETRFGDRVISLEGGISF